MKNEKWKMKNEKRKLKNEKWKKASDWSHYCDVARRRETSSNVAKLLLMVPLEHWQNSITFFGVAVIFATKIANFRAPLTLTSLTTWSTHSSKRKSLRWASSQRNIMEVIEVDHVEETKLSQPKHIPACRSVFDLNFIFHFDSMCKLGGSSTSLVNLSIILVITSIKAGNYQYDAGSYQIAQKLTLLKNQCWMIVTFNQNSGGLCQG